MLGDVLQARIREYAPANAIEQENMLAELMQHYVLASLSRSGLFSAAMFHGGTCLRIFHSMNRFSEDLDFLLKQPDRRFAWEPHLKRIAADCESEGLRFEIQDKNQAVGAVRKAFVKTDSIGSVVTLDLPFERVSSKKIRIKLEIDVNPPHGSSFETSYLSFPTTAPITTQTLSSGFGTKAHALLCRRYVKGRDWYAAVLGEGQLAAWKESLGADTAKWWRGHLRALRQNDAAGAKRADSGWGSVERAAVGAAWRIPIPAQVRGMVVGTLEVEWPPRHDSERAATSGPDTGATAAAASSCAPAPDPTS